MLGKLFSAKKIFINLILRYNKNMKPAIVPIILMEKTALIDPETRSNLLEIVKLKWWAKLVTIVLFCIGVVFLIVFVIIILNKYKVS